MVLQGEGNAVMRKSDDEDSDERADQIPSRNGGLSLNNSNMGHAFGEQSVRSRMTGSQFNDDFS